MLHGRAKAGGQSFGQQLVVCVQQRDGAVAVKQGRGAFAFLQQADDTLSHGGWQAMLVLKRVLQDCQQLRAQQVPELGIELIGQAI